MQRFINKVSHVEMKAFVMICWAGVFIQISQLLFSYWLLKNVETKKKYTEKNNWAEKKCW